MKKYISQFLALALSVMVIPALPVYISGKSAKAEKRTAAAEKKEVPSTSASDGVQQETSEVPLR